MTDVEVLELLQKVGAFRTGHFVFTSGRHGDTYVNKDAIYPHTQEVSRLCKEMADRFKDSDIEAVTGPAIGAAILAQWVAHHLSVLSGRDVLAVGAEKDGEGGFVLRRGYDQIVKGKRTLIVEDLTTTGSSVRKVIEALRNIDAHIAGAITLCNRGDVTKELVGNPPIFDQLVKVHLESWEESECELCKRGIPVNVEVGHGKQYAEKKAA